MYALQKEYDKYVNKYASWINQALYDKGMDINDFVKIVILRYDHWTQYLF